MYNLEKGNNFKSIYMFVKLYVEYNKVKIKRNQSS